jgi:hypothetical protein
MKTKNNVQKTALRTAAVIVSFVLISFTVAAQDFWKTLLTNSSFNQIALAMVDNSNKSDAVTPVTINHETNFVVVNDDDDKLAIEDWMTGNKYFNPSVLWQVEKENKLQVEDWMMNESIFVSNQETESPLALESWMTNNKVWNN